MSAARPMQGRHDPVPRARSVIYLVILTIALFLGWSYFASVNAVVRGLGRIEPRTATQTIQNLEGGIVEQILVTEGDIVEEGQLLALMDDTAFRSGFDELSGRADLLEMQILRLVAEAGPASDPVLDFPPDLVARAPDAAQVEQDLFRARVTQFRETLAILEEILAARSAELALLEPMAERGAVSGSDLIRARQAVLEVRQQITELRTGFEAGRVQALSELQGELAQIRQQLRIRAAQVERAELRAPTRGVVNRVVVQTAGGVVAPGGPILEILPLDDALVVAGRIAPSDIGPVFVGMPANVKLTAYDYRDYGSIRGEVVHVSADTVTDPETNPPEPFFEITVALQSQSLTGPEGEVFVRPGMLAEIELDAGERTVFHYLFNPLLRAREAFSEPD
jgi:membrane fusion protein, adhesin transport system